MNFEWIKTADKGQYENGFVEVYETLNKRGLKAVAIITYLPQFIDKNEQNVVLTVLLEGEKDYWTEGTIKSIFHDVEDRLKEMANLKFRTFNSLDYMMTQIFYLSKLETINYLSSGEQSFLDN